jgi:hypothetical protein
MRAYWHGSVEMTVTYNHLRHHHLPPHRSSVSIFPSVAQIHRRVMVAAMPVIPTGAEGCVSSCCDDPEAAELRTISLDCLVPKNLQALVDVFGPSHTVPPMHPLLFSHQHYPFVLVVAVAQGQSILLVIPFFIHSPSRRRACLGAPLRHVHLLGLSVRQSTARLSQEIQDFGLWCALCWPPLISGAARAGSLPGRRAVLAVADLWRCALRLLAGCPGRR